MEEILTGAKSGLIGGFLGTCFLILITFLNGKWRSKSSKALNAKVDNKTVSDADELWLKRSAFRLSKEKSNQKYPRWTWLLAGGLLPYSLCMAVTAGIAFMGLKVMAPDVDKDALSWVRMEIGASTVSAIFLGIFGTYILMIEWAKNTPIIRDYLTYRYGWGYLWSRPRGETEIKEELKHQLRTGNLTSESEYNSEEFSNLIFHRATPAYKKWTMGVLLLTLFLFILDSRYYNTVYSDHVDVSSYFSLKNNNYPIESISKVKRQCHLAVKKKRRYSWFEYDVEMEDGTKVVLLGSENAPKQPQQLAAIEAIIPLINKSAFEKTIVRSAPVLSLAPSLENCAILTKNTRSPKETKRLSKIFDLPRT